MAGVDFNVAAPRLAVAGAAPGADDPGAGAGRPLYSIMPPRPQPTPQGDPLPPHLWPPVETEPGTPAGTPVTGPRETGPVDPAAAPDPNTFTDGQGRVFHRRIDPATGHTLLEHTSTQSDTAGNRLELAITLDIAPVGGIQKTVHQHLALATGAVQDDVAVTTFDPQGQTTGEVSDFHSQEAAKETFEHTVGTYSAGQVVRRVTDLRQLETAAEANGERVDGEVKVTGVWENGGLPLTDAIVPTIDRHEKITYTSPGQGINKDTARTISTAKHATGTLTQLTYPKPMQLKVRFEGHGGQYIERELSVPLDAQGTPNMAAATTVGTDDHQSTPVKVLTNFRIFGGLASNLLGFAGIRLLASSGSIGRGLLFAGIGAGAAELVGEGHALLDKRNDGDPGRLFMAAYDTVWLGLVAAYTKGKPPTLDHKLFNTPVTKGAAMASLAAPGLAGAGLGLLGRQGNIDFRNPALGFETTAAGSRLLSRQLAPVAGVDNWREVNRFDGVARLDSVLHPQFEDLGGIGV